ncbi:MAG: dihydroneopterin aldolase [Tannerella sp.]|jgi:dihydroneopterin aldolase|nr:dihydroneopterin aldolase [Tannerella sp.]
MEESEILLKSLTIELKSLKYHAFHGVLPQERRVGNTFTVDVVFSYDSVQRAAASDDIGDAVNYADVCRVIGEVMARPVALLEHLAANILMALRDGFPAMTYIKLTVAKLNPPVSAEIGSVSASVEWKCQ